MRPEDLLSFLRKQPFQPFRMTLSDGRIYEVNHPELAMVGRSSVTLGLMRPQDAGPIYDRMVTVSLLHIMQIEPIVPAATSWIRRCRRSRRRRSPPGKPPLLGMGVIQ